MNKMTSTSLLNLDVDQVFAQNSIAEVESINAKVQAQIENKREELRMMVCIKFPLAEVPKLITTSFRWASVTGTLFWQPIRLQK